MDLRTNVEERISNYRAKLKLINQAVMAEMNKACHRRQMRLLRFLHAESEACSLALAELESLLPNSTAPEGDGSPAEAGQDNGINSPGDEDKQALPAKRIFRISTWGGIGDALLITPAIRVLKRQYPSCKIYVYCLSKSHKEVLMNNRYIDRLLCLGKLTMGIYHLFAPLNIVRVQQTNYGILAPSLFYGKSAAEIIGEMVGVRIDDPRPDCFLTEEEESAARKMVARYSNPVAIHVTAKSSPNKHWPAENWENLVRNNPHYSFLQLGSASDESIRGVIDLRGKTSLREALGIVKEAKVFVGVDSVLAHAAAAFRTPAVTIFGASTPVIWGHSTSKNLYKPPRCSPCIDVIGREPCPYGTMCMSNITVSDVERALYSSIAGAE